MEKDEKMVLTEAMVHSSTALGVYIVREIANTALVRQPTMSLKEFMAILDNHAAQVQKKQSVKTTINDPVTPPDVISL